MERRFKGKNQIKKKRRSFAILIAILIITSQLILFMTVFAADDETQGQSPVISDDANIEQPEPTPSGEVLLSQTPIASTEPTESMEPTESVEPTGAEPTDSVQPTDSTPPTESTKLDEPVAEMQVMGFKAMTIFASVSSDAALNSALSSATGTAEAQDVIEITGSFNITSAKTIASGKYVKLISTEGNTFKLTRGSLSYNMFDVQGSLTLENVIIDGGSWDTTKNTVKVSSGATFTMEPGSVLQNAWFRNTSGGSAVYNQGTFTLNGGEIKNNDVRMVSSVSGGVIYNAGTFTMTAGNITGNKAVSSTSGDCSVQGGVVYNNSGATFTMSGGVIGGAGAEANAATAFGGSSLYGGVVYNAGTFNMNGTALIKGNTFNTFSTFPYNNINGGAIYSTGTFTMAGSADISGTNGTVNNTFVYGVGVYSWGANAHFTMQDNAKISDNHVTTYDGNTNLKGGGVYNVSGSQFTMQGNAEISGNQLTATSGYCYGAGVDNETTGSLFTMKDNAKISNNTETSAGSNCGGGVYNYNYAQFDMQGGTISGNTVYSTNNASIGGGVYSYNNTIFTMSGGTITDNSTNSTIAGTYSRGGGVFTSNATFNMSGGTISANQANNTSGYSEGGGVLNWNIMNMTGGTITGNTAKKGGGVCNFTTFTMSGSALISLNTAMVEGGGVENSTGTFTMNGGTISGNTAPKGSGVLNAATYNLSGSAVLNTDNDVYLNSGKVINVTAEMTGTSLLAKITPVAYATGTTVVTLGAALSASDYASKFAVTPSGAAWGLATNAQNLQLFQEDVFLNGETGDDANNGATKATAVKSFEKAKSLLGPNGTIYICGIVTISGGEAFDWSLSDGQMIKRYKDANDPANDFKDVMIKLSPMSTLTLNHIIIDGGWDKTLVTGVESTSPIIELQFGDLIISTGAEIRNNNRVLTASAGFSLGSGVAGHGDVTVNGGKVTGNTLRVLEGGIYTANGAGIGLEESSTLTMTSGEISGNEIYSTYVSGGGVSITDGSSFTMSGGTICGNEVYSSGDEILGAVGGGVYFAGSTFTMSGGTICGNEVYSNGGAGGGVFIDYGCSFDMQGGTIGGSSAGDANKAHLGGGIYCYSSLTMSGGDIAGNDAELGGGVAFVGLTFTMSGGTIQNNHATVMGGGLVLGQGEFDMHGDASISGNSADNEGDGVYYNDGVFNLSGAASIAQNNPVYLCSGRSITITGTLDTQPAAWVIPENYPTGKNIVTAATADYTDGTGAVILPVIALADEDSGCEFQTSGNDVNIVATPIAITLSTAGADYTGSAITYSGSVNKPADVLISDLVFWYKVFGSDDSTYTTTKPINAGKYSVKATLTDNALYWDTESNAATFTINTINPILSDFSDQQADYTGSDFAIVPPTVTGVGGSDISGSGTMSYLYKLQSESDFIEGLPRDAGVYTVIARYLNNPNYNIDFRTNTVTIRKVALTASADDVSRPFASENVLHISYSGFVGSEDEDVIDTLPTAVTTATISSNVGDYTITVNGGSAKNYSFAYSPGTLTVDMATPDITFEDQSGSYSGKAFAITAPSITGAENIDLSSNGTLSYSYMPHTLGVSWTEGLPKDVGVYDVKAAFTGNANCSGGYDINVVTINKQILTVTANNNTKKFGAENPVLTIAYSGFVNGEDASNLSTLPTTSTTATSLSAAGTYPITVSGGSAANYTLIYVPGTLTVSAAETQPTSTPRPTPTPTATKTPSTTVSPTAAPTPAQSAVPSSTPHPSAATGTTITPSTIELDEEAGTVTIEIDVADLPEGTTAIQMQNGDVVYLDGSDTVKLEVKKEDLDENGKLNIVTLDNEDIPTGSFDVQIEDTDGLGIAPDTGNGFTGIMSVLLWIVVGIAGVGALAFIIIVILRRKRA